MNKQERLTVAVNRFAAEFGLTVEQVLQLIRLARRAKAAGERACNAPDPDHLEQRAADAFEAYAKECGFDGCDWPGLWPILQKNGHDVHSLPV